MGKNMKELIQMLDNLEADLKKLWKKLCKKFT